MPESAQMPGAQGAGDVVRMSAIGRRTVLRLKSWSADPAAGTTPTELAGHALPSQVGSVSPGATRVLCVGPGEWLVVSEEHQPPRLRERLDSALPGHHLVFTDLTDGLAVFEIRGSAARVVLAKGCGLDLHPRAFGQERCARTRFAQIPVLLECLDELPRFALYAPRSYSSYLYSWLADAAAELADDRK